MAIVSQALAWMGDAVLVLLLVRSFPARLIWAYGYFYVYVCSIICQDVAVRICGRIGLDATKFGYVAWAAELLTAVIGFGLIWEVYRQALKPYAGARVMTRDVIGTVFIVMIVRAYVALRGSSVKRLMPTTLHIEINLRLVQVIFLMVLLSLIFYYGIPLGRNLRYLLIGYGAYIGTHLLTLALVADHFTLRIGPSRLPMSQSLVVQFEYCVTLMIWCVGMWSWYREPVIITELQADYERVSGHTARAVSRLRDHIVSGWRK